jgi:polar amino acid transport system permease protein
MTSLDRFLDTFFNAAVMSRYLPAIVEGFFVTLQLAIVVVITGIALGLVLACLRSYQIRLVNVFIVVFADTFRALPPLVLILITYFGLPNVGISLSASW